MPILRYEKGQLLLPMLTSFLLFGLFWVGYVHWCRVVYWKMRMDMTADMVALSAARTQAGLLNEMATYQGMENFLMQKAKIFSIDVAHMQIKSQPVFEAVNGLLNFTHLVFKPVIMRTAQVVAHANGADRSPTPTTFLGHRLKPKNVHVFYFAGPIPKGKRNCQSAYFVRGKDWFPNKKQPQPPHQQRWVVCRGGICGEGRARLWLDVAADDLLNNGGFPSEQASFLRGLGIQSFYPQFNARLLHKR